MGERRAVGRLTPCQWSGFTICDIPLVARQACMAQELIRALHDHAGWDGVRDTK